MADKGLEAVGLISRANDVYHAGDSRRAFQLLDDAIAKLARDDVESRVVMLGQKASWLRESGYPEDSAKILGDAARELDPLPRSGHETEWSMLRKEQGMAAQERGDLQAAEALFADAETLARQSPVRDFILTDVLDNQADLYTQQGRLSDAQDVLLAALEIDQRLGNKVGEFNDLNKLGVIYGDLGDADTSRAYLTKALEVANQNGLTREVMDAKTNLAAQMNDAGDYRGAAEIFKEIERGRAESGDRWGEACSVANQGVSAFHAGDLEHAQALFMRSYEMHLAAGNWLHSVHDQLNLSGVAMERGHLDEALSYAQEAVMAARRFGLVEIQWATEYTIARCQAYLAAKTGDVSATIEGFEEALASYRRAADVVELLRSRIDRPEERESLLTDKEGIYEQAIMLCVAMRRGKDAFEFCERARMRSFLEALGSSRLERLEADDPAADRHHQLIARILSPDTPPGEKPGLMDELRIMRAEKMARRPALAAITEAQLPSEEDIRAAIPAETFVLEFFQTGNSVTGFLLDGVSLHCSKVELDEPVDVVVQRFRDEIDGGDTEMAAGSVLMDALLGPFMPMLATTKNLIVVPHRSLHYVPFSALWYEPAGDDAPPRAYLKNRFYLTTIPSASYLPYLARTTALDRKHGPAVVLGDPTGDLDGAAQEARLVAAKLGVTARLGAEATRRCLLGAADPVVLHVAGHGAYNPQDPLLSRLELADGAVTVEDLLSSGPAPSLLVLSGCVTGISGRRPGDELIGLAQAALRNGTRSVVATLWETFDESSAVFFEHFYDALTEGESVSTAIAAGRYALSTDPGGYGHPVDWAPFLLIGDPNQCIVDPDHTPMGAFSRGVRLAQEGDKEGAKAAFQLAIDSGSAEAAPSAAFRLGMLRSEEGDMEGALAAFQVAALSGDPDMAPRAMFSIGLLLADRDDVRGR